MSPTHGVQSVKYVYDDSLVWGLLRLVSIIVAYLDGMMGQTFIVKMFYCCTRHKYKTHNKDVIQHNHCNTTTAVQKQPQ